MSLKQALTFSVSYYEENCLRGPVFCTGWTCRKSTLILRQFHAPPPECIGRLFADPVDVDRRSGYGLVSGIDPQLRERDFGRERSLPVAFASVSNCKMVWRSPIGLTHTLILQLPRMRRLASWGIGRRRLSRVRQAVVRLRMLTGNTY